MICSVCKKEWVGAPDDTKCPYCGADLDKGSDQHSLAGVIAFLIKKEGVDVLLKPETVMSYISDLVKGHDREKKLMRVGSSNGIFQKAHALLIEPKQSRREVMVLDIRQHMMDNAFLSEENAVALINMVLEGIGLSSLRLAAKQVKKPAAAQPKPKSEPKAAQQPAAKPTASKPSRKPVHQTQPQNKKFRLKSISIFEYDGRSYSSRKVQGSVFLSGEARMIGVLLSFDPVAQNMNVTIDWQIFNQDNISVSGMIHGSSIINKGSFDLYQGWGWYVPGNWKAGRYTVKASMNGSNQMTAFFDIIDGKYDNSGFVLNSVKLFSSGAVPPSVADRKYAAVFSSHQARRIYFELGLAKVNTSVNTTMNYSITKPNGEILANYAVPIRFQAGDDRCWTGFGWDTPGHWQKGRYVYEVSLGNANGLFRGVFDIV